MLGICSDKEGPPEGIKVLNKGRAQVIAPPANEVQFCQPRGTPGVPQWPPVVCLCGWSISFRLLTKLRTMKIKNITCVLLTGVVLAGVLLGCATENESEAELQAQAKVSRSEAEKLALAKVPSGTIKEGEIETELRPVLVRFVKERNSGERFGDWCDRVFLKEIISSN